MTKYMGVLLALPLGEVDLRSKDGEGALREEPLPSCRCASSHLPQGDGFSDGGKLCGSTKRRPLGGAGFAQQRLRGYSRARRFRPLRRSRARFPLLSPTVTSSPGAGEVFPQRGSQAARLVAKVLGAMRKCPAALLPLPLGELSPQVTERAHAGKNPFRLAAARQATFPKGTAFCSGGKLSGCAKKLPLRGSWHGVSRD